jgi:sugar-specific transcriptional regulator TrmB
MFPTEKGKSIKAMIKILQENDIIIIPDRQFKEFYNSLKNDFKRDIGSYTSINDIKDSNFDNPYLDPFKKKLSPLITKYKSL